MKFPVLGKVLAVGAFAVGLTIVLARIGFLVDERAERQRHRHLAAHGMADDGGARGADSLAGRYAAARGLGLRVVE